jgi:hypothetical protein
MQKSKTPAINLLKTDQRKFIDIFTTWALSVGRAVVVITEIIALSAFLYRFSLDRQLVDLHDQIKQKEAIVKFSKTVEERYRNIQERLSLAQNLIAAPGPAKTFKDILSFAPSDMRINNIRISDESIRLDISAQSVASLKSFIGRLRTYPAINTVSIDKIENKTSSAQIVVNITATLKTQAKK